MTASVLSTDGFGQGEDKHSKGISALAIADQAVLDAIPAAVYVCAGDGTILRYNRRAAELWGRTPRTGDTHERYCGAARLFLLDGTPLPHAETPMASTLRTGEPAYGQEVIVERPDGSRRTLLVDIEAVIESDGRVSGAVNCFRDITQRKRAEEELRRSRQDLEDFFENGAVGLHLVAGDGTIVKANQAELDMLGYTAEEYFGRSIAEFHADAEVIADILQRLSAGERLDKYPARLRAKDGSIRHVEITSNVHFRDGEFLNTRCFTVDVTARHEAGQALRQRERQAREILDGLPAAIYTTDADGRITFYNEAAVEFSGRRPTLGSDEWCVTWKLYEPDGTPLPHDQCPMAVALKEGRAVRGAEAIAERPDGSRVPFMPFPTPLRDASGRVVGGVNMLVDISERKRAEEEQKILMDELNHRVKNTLAIIQSMAIHTLHTAHSPQEFREKFERRILALSKAHDLLTQRRWTGVGFRELVEAELAPYGAAEAGRIELEGEDVTLGPRSAVALAMVLHELATNAAKYGAFSRQGGKVAMRWQVEAASPLPRMTMHWVESGGPAASAPKSRGFGTRIVKHVIARDLAGEAHFDYDPAGLRLRAKISLP